MIESTGGPFEGFSYVVGQGLFLGLSAIFLLAALISYAINMKTNYFLIAISIVPALTAVWNCKKLNSYENPMYAQVVHLSNEVDICLSTAMDIPHFCRLIGESNIQGNKLLAYAEYKKTMFILSASDGSVFDRFNNDDPAFAFFSIDANKKYLYFPNINAFNGFLMRHFGISHHELKWKNLLGEFSKRDKSVMRASKYRGHISIQDIDNFIKIANRLRSTPVESQFTVRCVYPDNVIEIVENLKDGEQTWYVRLMDIRLPDAYYIDNYFSNPSDRFQAEFTLKNEEPCGVKAHDFLVQTIVGKQVIVEFGVVKMLNAISEARIYLIDNEGELKSVTEEMCAAGYAHGCEYATADLKKAAATAKALKFGIYGNKTCSFGPESVRNAGKFMSKPIERNTRTYPILPHADGELSTFLCTIYSCRTMVFIDKNIVPCDTTVTLMDELKYDSLKAAKDIDYYGLNRCEFDKYKILDKYNKSRYTLHFTGRRIQRLDTGLISHFNYRRTQRLNKGFVYFFSINEEEMNKLEHWKKLNKEMMKRQ
jgi:endonuclease YncB( thermonuclease family)